MRIALGIEYDGAAYYGWQRQKEVVSVQEELEKALSVVANHTVTVNCAGRTDAGVHGTGQVVHFDSQAIRKDVAWTLGVNANLPDDIAVRWVKHVDQSFHARFSASARRYRYIIYNGAFRPGILRTGLSHYHTPLDASMMQEAGQYILGQHDFTSFRALHCQANSPERCIEYIKIVRRSDFIVIDIKANAFLHHMVRNIAGSLIEIGRGNQPVDWLKTLLEYKDRAKAAATAKPGGLYLVEVDYPKEFDLPKPPCGPLFLDL
ncbi:tRNA pseudouridine(38-40) synthase TruA [Psychromonas antarctica]|jgi:tRNA pseudouridine38-40 synthase|uniref:tRNA pseudouridine(38-40) synthase TruA n=1 Tax=Psychromonas antarctica TaxID=67573 RepID=UPI001EE967F3|nr:tRNA pseudouridine(38-40) synthase TruA [Psychromonas antarctica]MCG6200608.1 tRNA pseudouridine(38-40) synthase TruA [Psychromonas antarctica]